MGTNTKHGNGEESSDLRNSLTRTSSLFIRVNEANDSVDDKKLWSIVAVIGLVLVGIHSLAYVTVEYGMFNGKNKYFQYTPAQTCLSELKKSSFDLLDTNNYEQWMDNDSTLSLAQTSEYKGPVDIRGYANFVLTSDYFDIVKRMNEIISTPLSFTDDSCSVLLTTSHKYQVKSRYGKEQCLETVVGFTLHFTPKPFKIGHISLFYSEDFLEQLFATSLNSDGAADYVCDIMESNCQETFAINNLTADSCRTTYNSLPPTNAKGYLDGKSKGCRTLHAAFAAENKDHCSHLSFIPQKDSLGRIKCQKSNEVKPSDLFSAYELETIGKQAHTWGYDKSMYQACRYDPDLEYEPLNFGKSFSFGETVPLENLNDYQFLVYAGFIMYATMVLTGLGMEYLVWRMYLHGDWDQSKENRWRVAQFLFPILGATTVGLANTGNYLALPLLVITMWKLGFPETILWFYSAMHDESLTFIRRVIEFIIGVGTIVHHSSSALYVAMLVTHVLPSTRDVLAVTLPLVMQHWFVLLKYNYKILYIVLEILVEVWFEWTAFSTLPAIHELHWTGGVILLSMLFAHWCYFGAGALSLVIGKDDGKDSDKLDQLHHVSAIAHAANRRNLMDRNLMPAGGRNLMAASCDNQVANEEGTAHVELEEGEREEVEGREEGLEDNVQWGWLDSGMECGQIGKGL